MNNLTLQKTCQKVNINGGDFFFWKKIWKTNAKLKNEGVHTFDLKLILKKLTQNHLLLKVKGCTVDVEIIWGFSQSNSNGKKEWK